jgi:putative methanogenesis marker protein 2
MVEIDLKQLVSEIKNYMGITRKSQIGEVVCSFPKLENQLSGLEVLADFGEDAAVFAKSGMNDNVLLLAADGIMPVMINADAYWSGYCSILVNLHDIAAMGGEPLAMVDVISVTNEDILAELTRGMNDACTKFGVPIVGGHVHPESDYNAVDVAILGTAKRSSVIYSHTAQVDDAIIFAMDLDGRVYPKARFAWDSTLHKKPEFVRKQLMVMNEFGRMGLVTAGKDISNPGALGTLGMLLESSKKGAEVDLGKIPHPSEDKIEFSHWLMVYQGCGFVVTCSRKNATGVIDIFNSVGLTANIVGKINDNKKFIINLKEDFETLFDFTIEKITGI